MAETRKYKVTYVDYVDAPNADVAIAIAEAAVKETTFFVEFVTVEEVPEPEEYDDDIPY